MLEALLARVQKRANEPRSPAVVIPPHKVPQIDGVQLSALQADTLPPPQDLAEEDIEEYDEELIEIIDDAEVIPQAAAAARAIDASAIMPALERRAAATNAAPPNLAPVRPAAPVAAARPAVPTEALRGETVSQRPIAATEVARSQGVRRDRKSVV